VNTDWGLHHEKLGSLNFNGTIGSSAYYIFNIVFIMMWCCDMLCDVVFSLSQGGEGIIMTGQNAGFAGPRNVASNAFLRQSPSPSALQASPAGLSAAPSRYGFILANVSLLPTS
jgi:hypothetical protein